jgi:hypothetical protein
MNISASRMMIALIAAAICTFGLSGCIAARSYRTNLSVVTVPPEPATLPEGHPKTGQESSCFEPNSATLKRLTPARDLQGNPVANSSGPCLAFLEFDDHGKAWDPSELDHATALIQKAITDDPQHQPVILTFIHGWKHNAKGGNDEDTNIQGVEHVLNYLHRCVYGGRDSSGEDCNGNKASQTRAAGHVVVGIFIAWRGDSVSEYWPVARTISVYSRGLAANRVGGNDVASALVRISAAAHPDSSAGLLNQPVLIMVGHSFGGRVMETAMLADYTHKLDRLEVKKNALLNGAAPGSADTKPVATFADLVLYVNSAASALSSVQLIKYMAIHRLEYRESDPDPEHPDKSLGIDRPLLLSVTTPGDSATGFFLPVAYGAYGAIKYKHGALHGLQDLTCFDPGQTPQAFKNDDLTRLFLYSRSAAHVDQLQSHELVDIGPPATPGDPATCSNVTAPNTYVYGVANRCFRIQPKQTLLNGKPRCNGTPYWIMNTDSDIIPDHSTIFTDRLIRFVGVFLPSPRASLITSPRLTIPAERAAPAQPAPQP